VKGETCEYASNSRYILILRFHSFFSFDAMVVSSLRSGVGGVGASQDGGI